MPAYYSAKIADFLEQKSLDIEGSLHRSAATLEGFETRRRAQTDAWHDEISMLKEVLCSVTEQLPESAKWGLLLEYPIPRRQVRIDAVILAAHVILVIEFKIGSVAFTRDDVRQVEDYALDLRDFHEGSREHVIVPILVATNAALTRLNNNSRHDSLLPHIYFANGELLTQTILQAVADNGNQGRKDVLDLQLWDLAQYHPVPSIIEAAQALFAGHQVMDIAHSHATGESLRNTTEELLAAVRYAQQSGKKIVCFVTGVPGAGKTLVGLSVAHSQEFRTADRSLAVFLSGNGPLVQVVQAALTRDYIRQHGTGSEVGNTARRRVKTFIQNVHEFLREYAENTERSPAPIERIVVFDEAQRAWDATQAQKKFQRSEAEAETMLRVMDRHVGWAVIICLVGEGQEIYRGEAGLAEWGHAITGKYSNWEVFTAPETHNGDTGLTGSRLFVSERPPLMWVYEKPSFHLSVATRTYKADADAVTNWVAAVLTGDADQAQVYAKNTGAYRLCLTRSLSSARNWLQSNARGSQRCGLLASSGATRLRAYGLETSRGFRASYPFVEWFLAPITDVRCADQLEVAASEFECQGLELDWTGVCWGGDFLWEPEGTGWLLRKFVSNKWQRIRKEGERIYLVNKYRVLLTRARQGMVLWVPQGRADDQTLAPAAFESTALYLQSCGVELL